jgi:anti-sigma factor RsiW
MKTCALFDRYRDGELNQLEKESFQSHLDACAGCRLKMSLLNNLAAVIKSEPVAMKDLSGQIARRAFQQNRTWDAVLLGWLRPGPAFVALSLVCLLFSTLWFVPNVRHANAFSEYEKLLDEANAVNIDSSISQIQRDTELVTWLEQEAR